MWFEVCGETGEGFESGLEAFRVQARIIEFLSTQTEAVHRRLIMEDAKDAVDAKKRTVERALEVLLLAGKVQKPKVGYYTLTESAPPAPTLYPGGNGGS